jgi:glycosyltransferase involved in cell wall biosynthesis
MPVYRDWASAADLCRSLDNLVTGGPKIHVLLVDDASPEGMTGWLSFRPRSLAGITVLRLRANLGHQRAICVGLCHIYEQMPAQWVLVMDSDGEDRPEDGLQLIHLAQQRQRAVIAARRKRLEGPVFRAGYSAFRLVHQVFTGYAVRAGNFSVIPQSLLKRLVVMPELWNHYAGAVYRSKADFDLEPFDRGKRLHGRSHMNVPALVAHGLAGIATFQETIATRILIAAFFGAAVLFALLAVVIAIGLWTKMVIPGWAAYTTGLLVLICIQLVAISFNLVFVLISNRSRYTFVPIRDYAVFIDQFERLDGERAMV